MSTADDKKSDKLRLRAEDLIQHTLSEDSRDDRFLSPEESKKTLQELRVHQIELEMQNEALRQAQAELEASRDRYVDLYDFAPVGYLTLNANGMIKELNLTAAALLGMERKALLLRRFTAQIIAEDQSRWLTLFLTVMEQDSKGSIEVSMQRGDGTVFPALLDCQRTRVMRSGIPGDGAGDTALLVALTDISERKQSETLLRQHERDIQSILNNMPSMIGYWDKNLRNRFGNHAYHTWFGIDEREMVGKHIREIIGEERYRLNLPYIEAALRGEQQVFERDIPAPNGVGIRCSLANYIPDCHEGEVRGFYVLVSDVTPLKQAQAELEKLRDHLDQLVSARTAELAQTKATLQISELSQDAIFAASPDAMLISDEQGMITMANQQVERLLGYAADELVGQSIEILVPGPFRRGHPELRDKFAASPVGRRMRRGLAVKALRKDGSECDVEVSLSRIDSGNGFSFVSVLHDITERRQAESLLADYTERLQELSSHLQTVREEERTHVARELHDELGQLLTALKMDVSLLQAVTPSRDGAAERLASMTRLTDEALGTIHRIVADLRPLMLDDLGLRAAVESLAEEFRKRYSSITCNLVFDLGGYKIEGEPATAAYRIVQECLTNVVRHAEASKVHIVVALQDRRRLFISVQDNGCGLQEPRTRTAGFGVLGMRERANALGGSLTIESMPGEGASVDVTIPLPDIDLGSATQ